MNWLVPGIAGFCGVLVMTVVLRRARFLRLPETQMVRAIGALITKDEDRALWPGFFVHLMAGIVFAYIYALMLTTAPSHADTSMGLFLYVVACTLMGLVHGLVVTLFLVIAVSQYHPLEAFRRLKPADMAAHVIGHIAYGATVGFALGWLPGLLG
jgi:uncharacterized membrane protein YagU involved in acid resistance